MHELGQHENQDGVAPRNQQEPLQQRQGMNSMNKATLVWLGLISLFIAGAWVRKHLF